MQTSQVIPAKENMISISNYLLEREINIEKNEIIKGLISEQKYISSKYFYDKKGSELFEEITQLKEYYPARTEKSILRSVAQNITEDFNNCSIIELGSGDCSKISIVLNSMKREQLETITYVPVDVSKSALKKSAKYLAVKFPGLKIQAVVADFMQQLNMLPKEGKRLFCFFGSTLGNLNSEEVAQFMKRLGSAMKPGDSLLLGVDMVKDLNVLEPAYNDSKQVTAKFNKNILYVINNVVETDFNPSDFEHLALYNKEKQRIEMHLKALKNITVRLNSGIGRIHIKKDETIHTENSHKFTLSKIKTLGILDGLETKKIYTDKNQWFSLAHYTK